jgi:hypothetical protein
MAFFGAWGPHIQPLAVQVAWKTMARRAIKRNGDKKKSARTPSDEPADETKGKRKRLWSLNRAVDLAVDAVVTSGGQSYEDGQEDKKQYMRHVK